MQERWQMNKLGFVNFWLYDWEEFPFSEGRLLLRGENGAGKSVTTQSFIPFMLDGDLRPYRLDSFGSKDRRMNYYLLGEQKEESTSYLYLEFVKPECRLYRTLVVGLHAKRSKPAVDFWGFCLSDGRRIGSGAGDFSLFETKGSQHISLSRQEVHNRFGSGENWAERGSDYKQMVNRMLFGYSELEQYERLLKLLIQLRKPKLSKDFSPHLVRTILNESLQPLSEDDIAPMVNSMEKMDDIQAQLDGLLLNLQEARQLRNEYIRYNQFLLGKKGEAYLSARHTVQERQELLRDKERDIARAENALADAKRRWQDSAQQAAELSHQLDTLQADRQLEDAMRQKESLRHAAAQQQLSIDQEQRLERNIRERISDTERRQRQIRRNLEDGQDALERDFAQLEELNSDLRYPGHPETLAKLDFDAQKPALKQYADNLRRAADLLRRQEHASEELDRLLKEQNAAALALNHAQSQLNEAEQQVVRERDALCGAFAALENSSLAFRLNHSETARLLKLADEYEGPAQDHEIGELLSAALRGLETPLVEKKAALRHSLLLRQQELNELAARRKELENQKELPPPRSQAVQETRALLQRHGIPHAAFYELVDFDDALAPEQRALLETQLADAGVLDALVLPANAKASAAPLLAEHPDHFLVLEDAPPVSAPLPLHPEADAPDWAEVETILGRLSAQPGGKVYFAADGSYRQGILRGHSVPARQASYIGASARRANRARQIADLSRQIEEKQREISEIRQQAQQTDALLAHLREEYANRPTAFDLAAALQIAAGQRTETERKEAAYEDCLQRVRQQQILLKELQAKFLPLARLFPYDRNAETYEFMLQCFEDYLDQLKDLASGKQKLALTQSLFNDLEQQLDGLNAELLLFTDRIRNLQAELRRIQLSLDALQQYLDRPETKALAEKLDRLARELKTAQDDLLAAQRDAGLRENDLAHDRPILHERKQHLQQAIEAEERKRRIFEEELCRGPGQPGRSSEPLWRQAETARDHIRQNDRNLGIDRMRASLEKNIRDAATLNAYRITLNTLFDSEDGELRSRACIDLYPNGQRMDLLDFILRIESHIEADRQLLSQEDRRLFETILNQTITTKLGHRINDSQEWTRHMSNIMQQLNTSMGLRFSLAWKGQPADQQEELDTRELIELLRKDPFLMGDADREKITSHFRAKIAKARESSRSDAAPATYSELMRQALDFRSWFTFHIYYRKGAGTAAADVPKKELTDSAFNSFSGGEKAMAMYVPLFAALSAQYEAAGTDAPQLMALDEAFAGVDETNIESMFTLVHQLNLNYIMNSQALWGCYASVSSLNIAELWRPQNADVVTVVRYHWNGHMLHLEES